MDNKRQQLPTANINMNLFRSFCVKQSFTVKVKHVQTNTSGVDWVGEMQQLLTISELRKKIQDLETTLHQVGPYMHLTHV